MQWAGLKALIHRNGVGIPHYFLQFRLPVEIIADIFLQAVSAMVMIEIQTMAAATVDTDGGRIIFIRMMNLS